MSPRLYLIVTATSGSLTAEKRPEYLLLSCVTAGTTAFQSVNKVIVSTLLANAAGFPKEDSLRLKEICTPAGMITHVYKRCF